MFAYGITKFYTYEHQYFYSYGRCKSINEYQCLYHFSEVNLNVTAPLRFYGTYGDPWVQKFWRICGLRYRDVWYVSIFFDRFPITAGI